MLLLSIFLSQALLGQGQRALTYTQGSRGPSPRLRKDGLWLGQALSEPSSFASVWCAVWGLGVGSLRKAARRSLQCLRSRTLEVCCNHVRKERVGTCQTPKAGSRQRKLCGFLSARDSPLGLSRRSKKIKPLSQR